MIATHLALKNWRNFHAVEVDLSDRVFLVGPNAAGKSNLLDVFRFLRDVAKKGGGLQYAVAERGGLSKIRCLAARRYPDVQIDICLADPTDTVPRWKYSLAIKQEASGHRRTLVAFEKVWDRGEQILSRPDKDDEQDEERRTQTHLEQVNANQKFRPAAEFLESALYLHLVPQLVRYSGAFSGPGVPGDPFGRSFLDRVARTPEKTRQTRLAKIENALKVAVPQLEGLKYTTDDVGTPHIEANYKHWRPKGAKQREDQFSDGTLRLIGLLWSLLEGDSLLLLEEPELSLNVGIVSKLAELMYRVQRKKKRQIVISTHSADLLSDKGIGGEEVLLLTPGEEGTQVERASSKREIRALLEAGVSVGEAVLPHLGPRDTKKLDTTLDLFE
jgi:predicted ATPase